ncbi:MAG: helix-hairpin-helix domain-containing protein [Myxococcales bacterium]|nr:helix-hairpin-helix domain-containing protein [Myxococcales bacterium]
MNLLRNLPMALTALLAANSIGCLTADNLPPDESGLGAEDAEDNDKSSFSYGLEDDAPDVLAVLHLANTYSVDDLVAAGVTNRVAKNIDAARRAAGAFASISALDKVPRVGAKVFSALRWHATVERLYPTSLRLPVVSDEYLALSLFNDEVVAAGLPAVRNHVWINADTSYEEFQAALTQKFAAAGMSADKISALTESTFNGIAHLQHAAASARIRQPCWIGDPTEVAAHVEGQAGSLFPDAFEVFAWRYENMGEVLYVPPDNNFLESREWTNHHIYTHTVRIAAGVDGDYTDIGALANCRFNR